MAEKLYYATDARGNQFKVSKKDAEALGLKVGKEAPTRTPEEPVVLSETAADPEEATAARKAK